VTRKEMFDAKRLRWNEKHNITIKGYEVELYVEDEGEEHSSSGIYSVTDEEWIDKPERTDTTIDIETAKKKASDIEQQIADIKEGWEAIKDNVIAHRGQWQNALPESAPAMIDATLTTLAGLVSKVSNTTRRGRAMRLAEVAAAMHLVNANSSLNNHLRRSQFNQFPEFCNHVAQAASSMYGVYILASQDGQDAVKEACIQLSDDQARIIEVQL